jgi:eukaryotic-like serine/threonine-protein kinase
MRTLRLPQGTWAYADGKPLGTPGGFAAVYGGMSDDGAPVAVKLFHSADPAVAKRELAFAEARLGRCDPHVITILGCGIDPSSGHACIVMPRAQHSLAQKLDADGPLDEAAALAIARAVVDGLMSVPDWVHRDIKPANLLWCGDRWQLSDFGIARQASALTATSTMKQFLSPPYAAPEQWDSERATHKTDVYALACMMQEVLTGLPPYVGSSREDFAEQHRAGGPKGIAGSTRMKTLLTLMLSVSPDARPSLDELRRHFTDVVPSTARTKGFNSLAQAAATVAETDVARHAEVAAASRALKNRSAMETDAYRQLDQVVEQLLDHIRREAPNAKFSEAGAHTVSLGHGQLTFAARQYQGISPHHFRVSGWDVVCGAFVGVTQRETFGRSASLWYARRGSGGSYEWVEVAYWTWGSANFENIVPCALHPGQDADFAAGPIAHTWQLAHPPRSLTGAGGEAFIERWLGHFAAAVAGGLQRPSRLPEE